MKMTTVLFISIAAVLLVGCTTVEADDTTTTSADWADGLTTKQVVETMPVSIDLMPVANAPQASGITKTNLDASQSLVVTWYFPKSHCGSGDCKLPSWWALYYQNPDGSWKDLDIRPSFYWDETIEGYVTVSVSIDYAIFGREEYLKVFKLSMPDHNNPGQWFDNIVTFMVCPNNRELAITLEDANADAASQLFLQSGYWLDSSEDLVAGGRNAREIVLPENQQALMTELAANEPIRFSIRTDFTDWNFNEDITVHHSNSSFCKVSRIMDTPDGVEWRFKFAFEDLPLDKNAIENNGLFDYNDMVFYVDVMENDSTDYTRELPLATPSF